MGTATSSNPDQKHIRFDISSKNSERFEEIQVILSNFLTQDECWVYHFKPETTHVFTPCKIAKVVSSAGKVMSSALWDANGIVFMDHLPKGQTINRDYYACLLRQLLETIKTKRREKLAKGLLFHQDNAPFTSR